MRYVLIVNPVSGKADASLTLVPRIVEACAKADVEYEICLTDHRGHAEELARSEAEKGEPVRLYACGGDGTLNEVLRGACGYDNAAVGCVPCGSGNDFIRNFGTKAQFADLDAQIEGTEYPIDLMSTNAGLCASICAAGLDAQVAYGIPKFRRFPLCGGSMAYLLSIAGSLCGKLGHRLSSEVDGRRMTEDCLLVAICNGTTYGGGFNAAPEADLQDGLLDVIVVRKVSRLRIAGILGIYKKGAHLKNGVVQPSVEDVLIYRRARSVKLHCLDDRDIIATVDGECAPTREVSVRVMPLAGRVVLPKGVNPGQNTAAAAGVGAP
ncbi:MAG: YegS/Rv2252/BmrU family lipid kinase [Oscillospiraceae bacterium]|nr:YegS/Rv2252/BmrU family lipid kinase [Oscillospiraceae bacterium]